MNRIPVYLLLLFAILLDVFAWPSLLVHIVPPFALLIVAYWAIHAPGYLGLGTAFIIGIVLDMTLDDVLGHHSVSYLIITYVLIKMHRQMRIYPVWQQSIIIAMMILGERVLFYWISVSLGRIPYDLWFLLGVVGTLLIWPLVFWLCSKVQRGFQIY
jgi:rod shape-determining protein MreD